LQGCGLGGSDSRLPQDALSLDSSVSVRPKFAMRRSRPSVSRSRPWSLAWIYHSLLVSLDRRLSGVHNVFGTQLLQQKTLCCGICQYGYEHVACWLTTDGAAIVFDPGLPGGSGRRIILTRFVLLGRWINMQIIFLIRVISLPVLSSFRAKRTPLYLADDCRLVSDSTRRSLWSAYISTCVVPRTLSSYGDRTFAAAGPRLWNSLPAQLRNPDYGLFRPGTSAGFWLGVNAPLPPEAKKITKWYILKYIWINIWSA